jgi:hypothetical protein
MALAALLLALVSLASVLISSLFENALKFLWFLAVLLPTPGGLFFFVVSMMCFVVSMMVCWKLIDIMRDRMPAAGSFLGQ